MSQPPLQFPTIEPDAKAPTLRRLRELSRLLDKVITIPGIKLSIGLDPIVGLLPVGGDFLGVLLSTYIVLEAARLGTPAATLARMVFHVIVDGLVGSIPIFGDAFDFAWTANEYNIRLLEDHLKFPSRRKRADRWFILTVLGVLLLFAIGLVVISVIVMRLLVAAFTGS
ncbi:MAG: DUF4112 domain-containing protein [Stigonema ocellatum SAG 48.90 = DSM 106950]|nr:DUF4112 domain-containing protein [Stigonema ocellatum SAG 48.90 = DSM 106950]